LGKKIPCSGLLFDAGKLMTRLRKLLGHTWGGGARPGWAMLRRKEKKKIVGHLTIWRDKLRKIRNSLFSNLFL
jgi:hypothetical protein